MSDHQFYILLLAFMVASTLGSAGALVLGEFLVRAIDRASANRRARMLRKNPFK